MPRFRSKPRTITAERFHKDKAHDPKGVCRGGMGCEEPALPYNNYPHVHTMHSGQSVQLADGDWIVPEPDGVHYYPIKDEVMKADWEQIAGPFTCPNCGGQQKTELSKCNNCRLRMCYRCLEGECFKSYHRSLPQRPAPDDLPYECDGTNCPPRAHDHKVLI